MLSDLCCSAVMTSGLWRDYQAISHTSLVLEEVEVQSGCPNPAGGNSSEVNFQNSDSLCLTLCALDLSECSLSQGLGRSTNWCVTRASQAAHICSQITANVKVNKISFG